MSPARTVFIGTDSGATTAKTAAVWNDGSPVSFELRQSATNSRQGPGAVIRGWVEGVDGFLQANGLEWDAVDGVGLALPGPFQQPGVLDRSANLPLTFAGWKFLDEYQEALRERCGRRLPIISGNDANFGGVAEARLIQAERDVSVLLLAPGSGLGVAYIGRDGLPLEGDTLAGMEAGHMAAPLHLLGNPRAYTCGCGRTWGCIEAYTSLSGLPDLLTDHLSHFPDHPIASSTIPVAENIFTLRGLAQQADPLALAIFDFQARALGLHIASLSMAVDAGQVVIGGGLMDPDATTPAFRERYLDRLRAAADPYLFPRQRREMQISAARLGDLSPAIGAALMARHHATQSLLVSSPT